MVRKFVSDNSIYIVGFVLALVVAFLIYFFNWHNPYVVADYSNHFSCVDGDKGIDFKLKSFAEGTDFYGKPIHLEDSCVGSKMISEVYCNEYNPWAGKHTGAYFVDSVVSSCPGGGRCIDGACEFGLSFDGSGCIDGDNGVNLVEIGKVISFINNQVNIEKVDECVSDYVIKEYYCEFGPNSPKINSQLFNCGSDEICKGGRCIDNPDLRTSGSLIDKIFSIF